MIPNVKPTVAFASILIVNEVHILSSCAFVSMVYYVAIKEVIVSEYYRRVKRSESMLEVA